MKDENNFEKKIKSPKECGTQVFQDKQLNYRPKLNSFGA
jgi:hypothetical protein